MCLQERDPEVNFYRAELTSRFLGCYHHENERGCFPHKRSDVFVVQKSPSSDSARNPCGIWLKASNNWRWKPSLPDLILFVFASFQPSLSKLPVQLLRCRATAVRYTTGFAKSAHVPPPMQPAVIVARSTFRDSGAIVSSRDLCGIWWYLVSPLSIHTAAARLFVKNQNRTLWYLMKSNYTVIKSPIFCLEPGSTSYDSNFPGASAISIRGTSASEAKPHARHAHHIRYR